MLLLRRQQLSWAAVLGTVLCWAALTAAQTIKVDYCSTINTGTTPGNYSDFQSQGLCRDFCRDRSFGLAIVQGNQCWCSSVLPSTGIQISTSKCRNSCPGFPADICGGDNTFGYMRINSNPVTATASHGGDTSSTPTSSGTTPKPTPSERTVTVDGTIKTVTVPVSVPDNPETASSEPSPPIASNPSGGLGGGAIAGIVVGVLAIFAIGGIIGFLVLRHKRRREEEAFQGSPSPEGSGAAMAHVPRSPDGADGFGGRPSARRTPNGTWGSDHSSSGRRSSMLMPGDPRMNPATGIYSRADLNKSHDSFLSIQDNRDYSRPVHEPLKVLKVTNASPDDVD